MALNGGDYYFANLERLINRRLLETIFALLLEEVFHLLVQSFERTAELILKSVDQALFIGSQLAWAGFATYS